MGFLGRTRSLKRKQNVPSRQQTENNQAGQESLSTATVVNITHEIDIKSAHASPIAELTSRWPAIADPTAKSTTRPQPFQQQQHEQEKLADQYTAEDRVFRFLPPSPPLSHQSHNSSIPADATIGIALGSPRLQPANYLDSPAVTAQGRNNSSTEPVPVVLPPPIQSATERQAPRTLRKQKSLGLKALLGRRSSKQPPPSQAASEPARQWESPVPTSYWPQQPPSTRTSISNPASDSMRAIQSPLSDGSAASTAGAIGHNRQGSEAWGFRRQQKRAELDRLHFEESLKFQRRSGQLAGSHLDAATSQIGPISSNVPEKLDDRSATMTTSEAKEVVTKNSTSGGESGATKTEPVRPLKINGQRPVLDIEIPTVQMERYSIMFEKLLNSPAPSLLERRRGSLKRLQSVGEQLVPVGAIWMMHRSDDR